MDRRNTRSMRSSSLEEDHETAPSRKDKQDSDAKSNKKHQNSQKGPSQSSSFEASHTGGSHKNKKGGQHTDTDESHEDSSKKHGQSSEKRTQKKGSENAQKEKHDNDNDDVKSKPSVSRVISSKYTPQRRIEPALSDSKKKVQPKTQSPAVFLEIRSSTSPFHSESPAQPKKKSGTSKEAKSVDKGDGGSKPQENVETSHFTAKDAKDSIHKESAQHKASARGFATHKEANQEEILADRMVGGDEEPENREGSIRFNNENQMFEEAHRADENHILIEQEGGSNPIENKKSSIYKMVHKFLQVDSSGGQGLAEVIRHDTSNIQEGPGRHEENQPSHQKYTIGEDLRIIEYVHSKLGGRVLSKNFWKAAVENDNLLEKKRSIDSLRDRYRSHLRYLSIDDCDRMKEWLNQNGERGYASFIKKAIKDSNGNIIYVKKLDSIDHDFGTNQHTNFHPNKDKKREIKAGKPEKARGKTSREKTKANQPSDYEEDDIESVQDNELYEEHVPVQRKEAPQREPVRSTHQTEWSPHPPRKQFAHLEEDLGTRQVEKRKNYDSMYQIDNQILPRKIVRELPSARQEERFFNTQEEEKLRDKETWLREQAQKNNISPDQMKSLFFRCSMNSLILDRYFRGEHKLIWDKDEDSLLTGPYKDIAKRVLSHYKGAANVRQREEFLAKFEHIHSMGAGNLAQKQSSHLAQIRRGFF